MMTYSKEIIMQLKIKPIFCVSKHDIMYSSKITGQKRSGTDVGLFCGTSGN